MIENLNKVHSIVEKGGLRCCFGSKQVQAIVCYDSIELSCQQCSGHCKIPAKTKTDLDIVNSLDIIEVPAHKRSQQEL